MVVRRISDVHRPGHCHHPGGRLGGLLGRLRSLPRQVGRAGLDRLRRLPLVVALARYGQGRRGAGLLVGLAVPVIGSIAGIGLVLYFTGAVMTVVRARWYSHIPYPLVYVAPVLVSIGLGLAARRP